MPVTLRMELASGEPADPPTLETSISNWRTGDSVFVSPRLRCRVVEVRTDVLVVEPVRLRRPRIAVVQRPIAAARER